MGSTRGIRIDTRERSTAMAAMGWRPLDEIDRTILDWEYGFPMTGPHLELVGIGLEEYKARVYALLDNAVAELWPQESVFRLRRRYG
jgi:hypothetical protein